MNYSVQPEVIKLKDIKPALYGYVREAHQMLASVEIPGDKTVHDVRVLMKKSRASVTLIKSQLEEEIFSREYMTFRETGRTMRSWRENTVHRKLLKNLKKKYPLALSGLESLPAVIRIMETVEPSMGNREQIKPEIDRIKDLLNKSLYRLRFMNLSNLDPKKLFNDLEVTFNKVSDCYLAARNNPKAPNLHEFRKRAKDFLYQLYFFRPLNPKAVKDLEKRLEMMTQNLGKYNDLAVLVIMLGYRYRKNRPHSELDELVVLIRDEQDKFLSKVWPSAYRLFSPGERLTNILGFKVLAI